MGIFNRRTGPDFIIIGAQKAGTTALHQMLQQHPKVISADTKEVHYFDNDDWYGLGNIKAYHRHFPRLSKSRSGVLTFEASPLYIYHPLVAERLYQYNPNLKLIAVLREPAARAFSAWTMYHHHFKTGPHQDLHDPRTFDEAIDEDLANLHSSDYRSDIRAYVKRGFYAAQLGQYNKYFPQEQLLVLENKDILNHWPATSKVVMNFLGLKHNEIPLQNALPSKVNEAQSYLGTIQALRDFYDPHNQALEDMLSREFGWNSK